MQLSYFFYLSNDKFFIESKSPIEHENTKHEDVKNWFSVTCVLSLLRDTRDTTRVGKRATYTAVHVPGIVVTT